MIIWALFDDGNSCYRKTLDNGTNTVYSIGINEINLINYSCIDLRITNKDLIKQLKYLPKPDIILASPPCESWSIADCGGSIWNKDMTFKNKYYYDKYNTKASLNKKRNYYNKISNMLNGIDTISATFKIIETFKPEYWVIENPKTSRIWYWIEKQIGSREGYYNDTNYSSYDNSYSLKPTRFYSNIKLTLKQDRVPGNKNYLIENNYNTRSNIPTDLIKDILWSIEIDRKRKDIKQLNLWELEQI